MKLRIEIGEKEHDLDIRRDGNKVLARVDNREYDLEVSEPESGIYLFKNGSKVTEVFVSPGVEASAPLQLFSGGLAFDVTVKDPKRLRGSSIGSEHAGGSAEIRTAMPGKVVRIIAQVGADVAKGDGIVVVEAMKMQNELKAPRAGRVKEILVEEGATAAAGQVLATIE